MWTRRERSPHDTLGGVFWVGVLLGYFCGFLLGYPVSAMVSACANNYGLYYNPSIL